MSIDNHLNVCYIVGTQEETMGHLTDYENAVTELDKALAAIDCSEAKAANDRAWGWADTAIGVAQAAGIENPEALVLGGRLPGLEPLKAALLDLAAANEIVTIVCNAFSLSMLSPAEHEVRFIPLTQARAAEFVAEGERWHSAVGHADTAAVFSAELGVAIPTNRASIDLVPHRSRLLVGQYLGPRLPEGATRLPEGAAIAWWLVVADK